MADRILPGHAGTLREQAVRGELCGVLFGGTSADTEFCVRERGHTGRHVAPSGSTWPGELPRPFPPMPSLDRAPAPDPRDAELAQLREQVARHERDEAKHRAYLEQHAAKYAAEFPHEPTCTTVLYPDHPWEGCNCVVGDIDRGCMGDVVAYLMRVQREGAALRTRCAELEARGARLEAVADALWVWRAATDAVRDHAGTGDQGAWDRLCTDEARAEEQCDAALAALAALAAKGGE